MSLTVNNNVNNITRSLAINAVKTDDSMKRMASGNRINSAKDDAAGLAIATRMQSNMKAMEVAKRNAGDGQSLAEAADAALGQTSDLLTRMKD